MKLEGDSFDRTLLVTVPGEIPDRESAMQQIFNAIRPGGVPSVIETLFDPHCQCRSIVRKTAMIFGLRENNLSGNAIA